MVSNHGFGALTDLNVLAAVATLHRLDNGRPTTPLVHQLAWTVGLGPLLEALGCRKASASTATEALGEGQNVLLFPGGDIESAKPSRDGARIKFSGRQGFARLALDAAVPVVPVVTYGASASLLVLSDGQDLARRLHLGQLLRLKAAPISISIPWGLSIGVAGLVPYLPLPVTLLTEVLPAMRPEHREDARSFAVRIEEAMQDAMTRLSSVGATTSQRG